MLRSCAALLHVLRVQHCSPLWQLLKALMHPSSNSRTISKKWTWLVFVTRTERLPALGESAV